MEEKINGIVINSVNYGENDKILTIFSLEKGLISATIKGVKKAGAKLKFAGEPFCFAEFILSVRGDKRTVIGASLTDSFYSIRTDIKRFYSGGVVLEFIKKFAIGGVESVELFLCAVNALKTISYEESDPILPLCRFLFESLKVSGYAIDTNGCGICKKEPIYRVFFDADRGCFFCEECFDGVGREIKLETYLCLKKIANKEKIENEAMFSVLRFFDFYIKSKTDENIKSLTELLKICN